MKNKSMAQASNVAVDLADKWADFFVPDVRFNKNGFEIRTSILEMARALVTEEFNYKFQGWELSSKRDEKTGQILTEVSMPEYPGIDKVLETAERMYSFVNTKKG